MAKNCIASMSARAQNALGNPFWFDATRTRRSFVEVVRRGAERYRLGSGGLGSAFHVLPDAAVARDDAYHY